MPDVPDFFSLNCVAGVVFSAFGFVVFTYGKRMRYCTPMLCGLALMLLPLFVADIALLVGNTLLGIAAVVFRHTKTPTLALQIPSQHLNVASLDQCRDLD